MSGHKMSGHKMSGHKMSGHKMWTQEVRTHVLFQIFLHLIINTKIKVVPNSLSRCQDTRCQDTRFQDKKCWDTRCQDTRCWDSRCQDTRCQDTRCQDTICQDTSFRTQYVRTQDVRTQYVCRDSICHGVRWQQHQYGRYGIFQINKCLNPCLLCQSGAMGNPAPVCQHFNSSSFASIQALCFLIRPESSSFPPFHMQWKQPLPRP